MNIKFIILLVFITCFSIVKSNENKLKCVNIGELCAEYSDGCIGGSCQAPNSTEEGLSIRYCLKIKKLNEPCIESPDCEFGLNCEKLIQNGPVDSETTCQESKFASFGESCSDHIDCVGSLKCLNSKCMSATFECKGTNDCPSEFFCNWNGCDIVDHGHNCTDARCVPVLGEGEYCEYDYNCKLGLICGNNKCVEKYSYQLGEKCNGRYIYEQCDIGKSLVCDDEDDGRCAKRNESTTNNCKNDGCEYEEETCDTRTGKCVHYDRLFTEKCKIAEKNRNKCFLSNKCTFSNDEHLMNLQKGSCLMKHCSNEIYQYASECFRDLFSNYCNQ